MSSIVETLVREAISANDAEGRRAHLGPPLCRYVEALLLANQGVNLVSRKDTHKHVGRFLRECLFLARILEDEPATGSEPQLLDIGSGGGFPGLVLKIALPHVRVSMIEGTLKKARFLAQACQQLDLAGVQVLWGRAEVLSDRRSPQFRRDLRHAFRWATAKGLGSVRESLDLAAPFLEPGGVHWTFKGKSYEEELGRCRRRMSQLQVQVHRIEPIPGDESSVILGLRRRAENVSRETSG